MRDRLSRVARKLRAVLGTSASSARPSPSPAAAVITRPPRTKTGVELTSMGTPTIVAGEAWIRNKGLTLDATSPEDYFQILDTLPLAERMPPEQVTRARKYAYHFFPFPVTTHLPMSVYAGDSKDGAASRTGKASSYFVSAHLAGTAEAARLRVECHGRHA